MVPNVWSHTEKHLMVIIIPHKIDQYVNTNINKIVDKFLERYFVLKYDNNKVYFAMADLLKFQKLEDVQFIQQQPILALVALCKLAFDQLKSGPSTAKLEAFSLKFDNPDVDKVRTAVDIILLLMVECVKTKLKNLQNFNSFYEFGFSEEQISVLHQFIQSKQEVVSKLLESQNDGALRFRDAEWRVEARVASRMLHSDATPIITMKLHLDSETCPEKKTTLNTTEKQVVLQTDPNTLSHLIKTLEGALVEAKSHRTKNFVKNFTKE